MTDERGTASKSQGLAGNPGQSTTSQSQEDGRGDRPERSAAADGTGQQMNTDPAELADRVARWLQEESFVNHLATVTYLKNLISQVCRAGLHLYLKQLKAKHGVTGDPIGEMYVEQIALLHDRIAALHAFASGNEHPDTVLLFSEIAVKLTREYRQLLRQFEEHCQQTKQSSATSPKALNITYRLDGECEEEVA